MVCVVVEFQLTYSPPSLSIHDRPSLAFFFVSSTDVHLIQRRKEKKEKYRTQEFTSSKERVPVDFLSLPHPRSSFFPLSILITVEVLQRGDSLVVVSGGILSISSHVCSGGSRRVSSSPALQQGIENSLIHAGEVPPLFYPSSFCCCFKTNSVLEFFESLTHKK